MTWIRRSGPKSSVRARLGRDPLIFRHRALRNGPGWRLSFASLSLVLLVGCSGVSPSTTATSPIAGNLPSPEPSISPAVSEPRKDHWSRVPLRPDVAFENAAREKCLPDLNIDPRIPLVLHDQRTVNLAALLFEGGSDVAIQVVQRRDDGALGCEGGGGGSRPSVVEHRLAITNWIDVTTEAREAALISGYVEPAVSRVWVELLDGSHVQATVGEGRFLALWKGRPGLAMVAAFDSAGQEVARIDDPFLLNGPSP